MKFEVLNVSRGDVRLKYGNRHVRVLGEALMASAPGEPSFVIYLNSLKTWEKPAEDALTESDKDEIVAAIRKHFEDRGSVVEFE